VLRGEIRQSSCRNKIKKDMAAFTAPPEYGLAVDLKKVCWEVMEGWIMQRVTELLRGVEDEVLVGTILESLKAVRELNSTIQANYAIEF
jgi:hypothetical protein